MKHDDETQKKPGEAVETNIGNVPMEDLRDILAIQSGFDNYEDMRKQGYRFGNIYDSDYIPQKEEPELYKQDRFYMNFERNTVVWMYNNPDAISGNQIVSNIFDKNLLEEALKTNDPFDYISTECTQYCTDPDDYAFEVAKEKFENEPDAIGCNSDTLGRIKLLFNARDLIEEYCEEEFDMPADFSNSKRIGLAYTTTEDDLHEIEVVANLTEYQTETYVDGNLFAVRRSDSLFDYVNEQLANLDFCELTSSYNSEIEAITTPNQNEEQLM